MVLPCSSASLLGPLRALIDPGAQQSNFVHRQGIALRRHLHVLYEPRNKMDEWTLGAVARPNIGAMVLAAFECGFLLVETELAFLLVGSVALDALRIKDGFDVLRE